MSGKNKHGVCILGAPGSGKTCFLAGLAFLAESTQHNIYQIKGERGTSTHRWLADLARTIRGGDWPPSTTGTRFYDFDLVFKDHLLTLSMIDYAGDSLVETLGELDQNQTLEIGEYLKNCETLILLLDPSFDLVDPASAAPEAKNYSADRVNALLTVVLDSALSQALNNMDVAIVISKADTISGSHDAAQAKKMTEKTLPGFYRKLRNISGGKSLGHFFISSVGATELSEDGFPKPAEQVSPRGYDAIFDWIIKQSSQKKLRKAGRILTKMTLGAAFIGLTAAVLSFLLLIKPREEIINSPLNPLEKKIVAFNTLPQLLRRDEWKTALENQVGQALARIREETGRASTETQRQNSLDELLGLKGLLPDSSYQEEIKRLETEIIDLMENMLFGKIERNMTEKQWDEAMGNAREYFNKFPGGAHRPRVEVMREEAYAELEKQYRRQVANVTLAGRPKTQWGVFLNQKAEGVEKFVDAREVKNPEKEDMLKAASLARYLANNSEYSLTVVGVQGLRKPRETYIKIRINNEEDPESVTAPEDAMNPVWRRNMVIRWKPGDAVQIDWLARNLFMADGLIAGIKSDDIWALQNFTGDVALTTADNWKEDVQQISGSNPVVKVELLMKDRKKFETGDWSLLREYIHPGGYWDK